MSIKNISFLAIYFLGLVSFCAGIYNLIKFGDDSQIEGSIFLLRNLSPYRIYIENPELFRYSRIPTHLPQEYYILMPFALLGDFIGYLAYGLVGVAILIACTYKKIRDTNYNYLILIFLLFATTSYRNNVGLGQFLFFYFGIFLLYDQLIRIKNNKYFTYIVCPILLVILAAKPTSFFWIPFFYSLDSNKLKVYGLAFIYQIFIIAFFLIHTNASFLEFITDYGKVLTQHSHLTSSVSSVFSISNLNIYAQLNSILVIFCLILVILIYYLKTIKGLLIDESIFLFSVIVLSFIFVYHSSADSFLLLSPLFIKKETKFEKRFFFLISLFIYMVFQKIIFITTGNSDTGKYINNSLVILFSILYILHNLYIDFRLTEFSFSKK